MASGDLLKNLFRSFKQGDEETMKLHNSHLAAKILKEYPDASANLVRALIANSASTPAVGLEHFDENECLNLFGYGKPEVERALFSDDNRVTLIADDEIQLDSIHLYEIPIPEEFQTLNGSRKISVSLAYDPPVRNTRRDYLGIKMGFKLFRGLETQQIIDYYAKRTDDNNPDRIPKGYQCSMMPSTQRRETSTLQKGIFKASKNQVFTNYAEHGGNFHLLVTCQAEWASAAEFGTQRYALVVTVEHEDGFIA